MHFSKSILLTRLLERRKNRSAWFLHGRNNKDQNHNDSINFEKGTAFETFVVRKFNPEYFTLIEWRSDKQVDGNFPIMSKFPDLELYFESQTESAFLAIECKWRETFRWNKIELERSHIENYRHYEQVTGIPTFLAIGVGNKPSLPNHLYIIPLSAITSYTLHEFEMEVYRRQRPHELFFYNCQKKLLT